MPNLWSSRCSRTARFRTATDPQPFSSFVRRAGIHPRAGRWLLLRVRDRSTSGSAAGGGAAAALRLDQVQRAERHLDEVHDGRCGCPASHSESEFAGLTYKDDSTLSRLNRLGFARTWRPDPQADLGIDSAIRRDRVDPGPADTQHGRDIGGEVRPAGRAARPPCARTHARHAGGAGVGGQVGSTGRLHGVRGAGRDAGARTPRLHDRVGGTRPLFHTHDAARLSRTERLRDRIAGNASLYARKLAGCDCASGPSGANCARQPIRDHSRRSVHARVPAGPRQDSRATSRSRLASPCSARGT